MYTALNNKNLYLSDGAYLGKMLGLEYKTASDAYITTDRKLPRDISANEYIYTSTEKTNGLYLINTQGLRSGGVLQLVNSELSTEGRPIIYNASLDTNSNGNLNYNDLSLIDYPNIYFVGDALSARGITVSGAQGTYVAEDILCKVKFPDFHENNLF